MSRAPHLDPLPSADDGDDLDSKALVCPITAELFKDPVLLVEDGYTYERDAVTKWLTKHDTSPMTGGTLKSRALAPNIRARQQSDEARGGNAPKGMTRSNEVCSIGGIEKQNEKQRVNNQPQSRLLPARWERVRGERVRESVRNQASTATPPAEVVPRVVQMERAPSAPSVLSTFAPAQNALIGGTHSPPESSAHSPSQLALWVQNHSAPNGGPKTHQLSTFAWFDRTFPGRRKTHRAAMRGDVAELRRIQNDLGDIYFDPDERMIEWFESEPLGWAASLGQLHALRELIVLGADPLRPPNTSGNTPLSDAAREGHQHVISFLKEYAYRHQQERNGTPVHHQTSLDPSIYQGIQASHAGTSSEENWGFVVFPILGHPFNDAGYYHSPFGCCFVRSDRHANRDALDGSCFFDTFIMGVTGLWVTFTLLWVMTCGYKPCGPGGCAWWGDAPCTEQRASPQFARHCPQCLTKGPAFERYWDRHLDAHRTPQTRVTERTPTQDAIAPADHAPSAPPVKRMRGTVSLPRV